MVVISLTTVPERNGTIQPTIDSLRAQQPKPDQIRLYLYKDCEWVEGALNYHCEDLGPITKLSAVLDDKLPQDTIIVTADDDKTYTEGWLLSLLYGADSYPKDAVGLSGYDVETFFKRRGVFPKPKQQPCTVDVLEGTFGVAYRKWMFEKDVLEVPQKLINDDIWIGGYLNKKGITRRVVSAPRSIDRHTTPGLHGRADFYQMSKQNAADFFPVMR